MAKPRLSLRGDTGPLLGRLWHAWVRPHTPTLVVILALIAVGAAATSLYPLLIKYAFDAFDRRDMGAIQWAPLVVVVVTAVKGFALYGQVVLVNRVVTRVEADMQAALYARLIDADLAVLGRESAAALTQRFTTDFSYIKEALTRLATVFVRDVLTVAALVCAMLWIDPVATLAAGVLAPIVAPPIARIGKKLRHVSTATQEQIGAMAGLVSESLAGARVAKAYRLEGYLKGRVADAFEGVRRLKMKAANARARLDPLLEIGGGVGVAAVLALIGWRIGQGATTIGDFTGFVTALLLAAQPIRALGNLHAILQEAAAALKRYFAVMDTAPTIADRPGAAPLEVSRGEVRFLGVGFRYRPDAAALTGVDLVAAGGRTTALVGRSGSGKSTLLALVPRFFDAGEGRILIDGQDIRDVNIASLRDAVAVVTQDVVLFDGTVRDNIAFGRPQAGQDAIEAAARAAAAHDFIACLPAGYDTIVGPGGTQLSGGERQRVSLARAFLKDAPILLLDEATSALDAESERLVQAALAELMRGRTTLVIAHRLATVRDADLIVVMEGGRVVETGSHDELFARAGAYARLVRLQMSRDEVA
ncbi:ABC transporter ATP-binding protein [Salinarimonas soli]|uniref:ATP-binding cassette domain-containing protein n=1 Tax=Salinarimonas soli TaxID=1638099 RepID=A0A5B2V8W8_9HYPH|nr:ABC transporter transmembrane domain-containing protein [Salinarimonas soli]KAA2234900.1 ATP-binding cassette domain-containing protein [Salinarimonas soli]